MKTTLLTIGTALAVILTLFTSALAEADGNTAKAQSILQHKAMERTLNGVSTHSTNLGQKLHYFPADTAEKFQKMLLAYCALHPDERIVTFAGDSEGNQHEKGRGYHSDVSRHLGYHVVTEKVN